MSTSGRVVYLDCSSGASGDMLLGALVDLGLPLAELEAALAGVPLAGYRLASRPVTRAGFRATKVDVVLERDPGASHRHLPEILDLLDRSAIDAGVKAKAAGLFRRLAEVEGEVHGTPVENVHFHELGAIDAIVDIVGGVWGLARLSAARIVASPLNLGSGSVTMAHGVVPVPAPATARLVTGAPVYGAGEGELLTPTGALLVTAHAESYGPLPPLRLEQVGCGAGDRDTPGRPNILRILVGEGEARGERVLVMEAEVDDMSPQLFGPLVERLLAAGALDVYGTPLYMKKGRPGLLVTTLCDPSRREALETIIFSETTTLGIRRQEWERTTLERELVSVETPYGPIGIKIGRRGETVLNAQPEFDECQRAAWTRGVAVKEVWAAAVAAYRNLTGRLP